MKLPGRTRWMCAAAALAAGLAAGCGDAARPADPKPVSVKEDPRLKRAGDPATPGQNVTGSQLK